METEEWTQEESEQIGRWISGIVVGEFQHNGELTVGWARLAYGAKKFVTTLTAAFADLGKVGNNLAERLVRASESVERKAQDV